MKKILMAIMMVTSLTLMPATAQAKTLIDYGEMAITAYCDCYECSEGYGRKCALEGRTCKSEHTIAVDPDVIDLGSKVKIGNKIYVAEDTGSAVQGDVIDIFFDTHEEVKEFGVKYVKTWVVKQ